MSYEEIEGVRLNPGALKAQLASINQNLTYQNAAYVLMSDRISGFCEEGSLKASSIEGFKSQMENYESVFDALTYANELDSYDISSVYSIIDSAIGDEVLDGSEILSFINQAESDYDTYSFKSDYWYKEFDNAGVLEFIYADLCYITSKYYESLANEALNDKGYWEGRAELLINLSSELSGLFSKGNEFRQCANEGLQAISTAFDGDTEAYLDTDNTWKKKLNGLINTSVYNEDNTINWAYVKHILSKDADAISDSEYQAVATAYLNADTEELEDFFMMCSAPEEVSIAKHAEMFNNDEISLSQTVFVMDSEKINNVCDVADKYQASLLSLEKSESISDEVKTDLENERDDVIQKITVAQTMSGIGFFYSESDNEDYFSFDTTQSIGDDYNIEITYNTIHGKYVDNGTGFPSGWPSIETHTATVSSTYKDYFSDAISQGNYDYMIGQFTKYSSSTVSDDVCSQFVNDVLDQATGNGLSSFGIGLAMDLYENESNIQAVNDVRDSEKLMLNIKDFGCYGNVVTYDDGTMSVSLFEGVETEELVEEKNESYKGLNLTIDEVVKNPLEAHDNFTSYMEEYGD